MNIVIAGPGSAPYAREYLSNMAVTLRGRGHRVFVTHEGDWSPPAQPHARNRFDFEATRRALEEAELLLAVLDGYTVDDAVAAQIGIFYTLARQGGDSPRRMAGLLHDTRVAGWTWSGADRALTPQIREMVNAFGAVYPDFQRALTALEAEGL